MVKQKITTKIFSKSEDLRQLPLSRPKEEQPNVQSRNESSYDGVCLSHITDPLTLEYGPKDCP